MCTILAASKSQRSQFYSSLCFCFAMILSVWLHGDYIMSSWNFFTLPALKVSVSSDFWVMLTECQLRADSFVATWMDMCVLCCLIVECFGLYLDPVRLLRGKNLILLFVLVSRCYFGSIFGFLCFFLLIVFSMYLLSRVHCIEDYGVQ